MSSETTTKTVASVEDATNYIKNTLVTGELNMKEATKALGWSFPRIRSRAKTICKKLDGVFTKKSRGIYFLETNVTAVESKAEVEKTDEE